MVYYESATGGALNLAMAKWISGGISLNFAVGFNLNFLQLFYLQQGAERVPAKCICFCCICSIFKNEEFFLLSMFLDTEEEMHHVGIKVSFMEKKQLNLLKYLKPCQKKGF